MAANDYPIDVRFDYPQRSSRGWAALTITFIKFLALIPHGFALFFLGIAQLVVAFVAQVVVAVTGEYPPGMFDFVAGVLRWSTRVSAFLYSLNDRYPPFTMQPDPDYPVDLVIERPPRSSRLYAVFTVVVEILSVAVLVWLVVYLVHHLSSGTASGGTFVPAGSSNTFDQTSHFHFTNFNMPSFSASGLVLRQIAALPHLIVLAILGLVLFVIFLIVQWVILFRAVYPRSMFDLSAGIMRWQARVSGYALGLIDRYPPFTLEPSLTAIGPTGPFGPSAWGPTTPYGPATPYGPTASYGPTTPYAPTTPVAWAPPNWYPDPSCRHEYRFWDGTSWTPHVADQGSTGWDLPGS